MLARRQALYVIGVAAAVACVTLRPDGGVGAAAGPVRQRPSDLARLTLRAVITGRISPKSVASSGTGFVLAQNMMYRHTITVYDARTLKLVRTISDAVHLRRLGYPRLRGIVRGAPVEAAFSPDGRYAYVSTCSMS